MSRSGAPDPHAIFLYAEAFAEAAEELQPQFRKKPPGRLHIPDAAHAAPAATLDAFALELYLKCLYVLDHSDSAWGHDTEKLIGELKPGTQDSLRSHYEVVLSGHAEIVAELERDHPGLQEFDRALATSSKAFETLRYLFEGVSNVLFYWPLIRLAARATVLSMQPTWEPSN